MLRAIEQCQTNISKVFLTHAHKNHISCIGDIIKNFGGLVKADGQKSNK